MKPSITSFVKACYRLSSLALVVGGLFSANSAFAAVTTFDLAWSGASFSNSAVATGTITVDTALLDNNTLNFNYAGIQALSITISGASSGNGTYGLSDFTNVVFDNAGVSFDYSAGTNLVGQSTGGGPWGTGFGGDFNLFGSGPIGTSPFVLAIGSDFMQLTDFSNSIPEPSTYAAIFGVVVLGFVAYRRRQACA